MKLIAWNQTTCPMADGGAPACPSALWFWVALAVAAMAGMFKRKGKA